jgi:hypothetical protein
MTQPRVHRPNQPGPQGGFARPEAGHADAYSPSQYSGHGYSGQAYSGQGYSGQQHSSGSNPAQLHSGQHLSGQHYSGPHFSGQHNSVQHNPEQQNWGQPYPGQQHSGQQQPGQQHWQPNSAWPPPAAAQGRPAGRFPAQPGHPAPPGFPARPDARHSPPPTPAARPPRKRRLALVVGLLVVAGLAAAAVVLGAAAQPERVPDTGAIAQPGTLSVFELQPGDCYNTTQAPPPPGQSQPISVVEAVQCTAPHTNQVVAKITYSTTEYTAGVPEAKTDADCTGEFQAKLDPAAFSDPTLKPGRLSPADPATWSRTPVVACVVFSDNPISRSLLR